MPELPEVETVCRDLSSLAGHEVIEVQIYTPSVIREQAYPGVGLVGRRLRQVARRGKFIVLSFSGRHYLLVHMGMSGRLFMRPADDIPTYKHVHLLVRMSGDIQIIFQDARRFGGLWFTRLPRSILGKLGVEPLTAEFNADKLQQLCQDRKQAIKGILLNQNLIAGIGNIYADEALFQAGIRPDKPGGELAYTELSDLTAAIRQVLTQSIEAHGTTFRDYRDGKRQPGNFQNFLQVYGRNNQECVKCGNLIKKIKMSGRGTHFCDHCQK